MMLSNLQQVIVVNLIDTILKMKRLSQQAHKGVLEYEPWGQLLYRWLKQECVISGVDNCVFIFIL